MKWKLLFITVLVLFFVSSSPGEETKRTDSVMWDLSPLYADQASWEKERDYVIDLLPKIGRWKKEPVTDATRLLEMLDEVSDLRSRAGKLSIYGFLVSDVNSKSAVAKNQYEVGTALESQVESAVSFLPESIARLGKQQIESWMKEEPRLQKHVSRINRIQSEAKYAPTSEAKAVLEDAMRWPRLSADAFGALHETDLGLPINRSDYFKLRASPHSKERIRSMTAYLNSLARLQDVFALLYTRRVEADLLLAKHRGFKDGIDAIWFLREGLPPGSQRVLVEQTRKQLPIFHRLAKLRSLAIGSSNPSYPDLFVQPAAAGTTFSIQQAEKIALTVSEPMGEQYVQRLKERIKLPWMHLEPHPEKRITYAIWPPVGGIPPYIIMNYDGTYDSARRYVGALTLMMSFAGWGESNAPDTRDDPGIYSNAMIYVGDLLFDDSMIQTARTSREKMLYLIQSWDFLRHHYFQWVLCTEFDIKVQEMIRNGDIPNGDQLTEMYLQLQREYYGFSVDEAFGREWMLNSVPFLSYEHEFWPPAVVAATNIVKGLEQGDPGSRKAIDQVLGRTLSDRTHGLFLAVNLDLTKPEATRALFERAERILNELQSLIDPIQSNR